MKTERRTFEVYAYKGGGRHGLNVQKVSRDDGRLLEQQGWEIVRRGDAYIYVRHPSGEKIKPTLTFDVPVADELRELALTLHSAGEKTSGVLPGGWMYQYCPSETVTMRSRILGENVVAGEIRRVEYPKISTHRTMSEFKITGQLCQIQGHTIAIAAPLQWMMSWSNGDDAPPIEVSPD